MGIKHTPQLIPSPSQTTLKTTPQPPMINNAHEGAYMLGNILNFRGFGVFIIRGDLLPFNTHRIPFSRDPEALNRGALECAGTYPDLGNTESCCGKCKGMCCQSQRRDGSSRHNYNSWCRKPTGHAIFLHIGASGVGSILGQLKGAAAQKPRI